MKKRPFWLTVALVVDNSNSIVLLAVFFFFTKKEFRKTFFIYLDSS